MIEMRPNWSIQHMTWDHSLLWVVILWYSILGYLNFLFLYFRWSNSVNINVPKNIRDLFNNTRIPIEYMYITYKEQLFHNSLKKKNYYFIPCLWALIMIICEHRSYFIRVSIFPCCFFFLFLIYLGYWVWNHQIRKLHKR